MERETPKAWGRMRLTLALEPRMERTHTPRILHFGLFELNLSTDELSREGHVVKLQPHPFTVLAYLAANSERVVTREELYRHVWKETIVEWDQGLNFCIREVRRALGDNARSPSFIKTLPRRGYRFIAPISETGPEQVEISSSGRIRKNFFDWRGIVAAAAVVGVLVVAGASVPGANGARSSVQELSASPLAMDLYFEGNQFFRRNLIHGDVVASVDRFSEAASVDPDFARAHAMAGIARLSLVFIWNDESQRERGMADVARATELAPDDPIVLLARGYGSYYGDGQYDEALGFLNRAAELSPNWDEAINLFQRANEIDPGLHETKWALARTHVRLRQFAEADRYLRQTAAILPNFLGNTRLSVFNQIIGRGDAATAYAEVRAVRGAAPRAGIILSNRVLSRTLANLVDDEIFSLSHDRVSVDCVLYYSNLAETFAALGMNYRAEAHWDSARVLLEHRFEEFPESHLTARQLALVSAALGDVRGARDYMERARALAPPGSDAYDSPDVSYHRAEVMFRIGEFDEAMDLLEALLEMPHWTTREMLIADPLWEPLKRNERFQRMVGLDVRS